MLKYLNNVIRPQYKKLAYSLFIYIINTNNAPIIYQYRIHLTNIFENYRNFLLLFECIRSLVLLFSFFDIIFIYSILFSQTYISDKYFSL